MAEPVEPVEPAEPAEPGEPAEPAEPGEPAEAALRSQGAAPARSTEHLPATHTTSGKLADLERRRYEAVHAGSTQAVEKQHAKGKQTARERIAALLDPGSFVELDEFARHRSTEFGLDRKRPYGDGVVTGHGTVDGRPVCVFAQDVTIFGGSLGEVYGEKIVKVMDLALKTGCPIIGINEGAGARIQEGVVSLGLYGQIFYRNTMASGVIPQISLIMGTCAGGHVYSPALTDFTIMVDQTSHMFITGPDVIKTVTGEDVGFEELGGGRTHNTKSGNAHYLATDEQDALDFVRTLLSYLPSNNLEDPPAYDEEAALEPTDLDAELDALVPDSPNAPYDMHLAIEAVLDDQEFLEVQPLSRRTPSWGSVAWRAARSASWPISRCSSPEPWTSTHRRRRRGSYGPATPSTCRSSHSWTYPGSSQAPTRSGTASSAAARSSSTRTARQPCRRSR
jgi:propionyl-CoA carboxylase beta chain